MRLAVSAAALLMLVMGGCVDAFDEAGDPAMDCSHDSAVLQSAFTTALLPKEMPEDARAPFGLAKVVVTARAGQSVYAVASFGAIAGTIDVAYDGPPADMTRTTSAWTAQGIATRNGDVTVELIGAPFASGVAYNLAANAVGCTPRPA